MGPSGPKWKRESEMSSRGLSASGVQKVPNGVENESKSTLFQLFDTFSTPFWTFLAPRSQEALGAQKGPKDPCTGQKFSQTYLRKNTPEELFSGGMRQIRVINYAKEFSENGFLRSYVNFA